jgi:hypothetical protein
MVKMSTNDKVLHAIEIGVAALLGGIVSNLIAVIWGSGDPLNLRLLSYVVLFIIIVMILMIITYYAFEWMENH